MYNGLKELRLVFMWFLVEDRMMSEGTMFKDNKDKQFKNDKHLIRQKGSCIVTSGRQITFKP